jgi:hypothetical protein
VRCRYQTAIFLLASLSGAPSATAILIRADRDDAEYLELATRYPSAIALPGANGEGALIARRWVLTTARAARGVRDMKPAARLEIASRGYEIESIVLHPDWNGAEANDIALILLRSEVKDVEPSPVYAGADEAGKGVIVVGHGAGGKIGDSVRGAEAKKRAAINTVDRVTPRTLGLRIKNADEATDLQGAATPAEVGAPALIETRQAIFVAGVLHAATGEWETYTRASAFLPWINAVLLQFEVDEAQKLLDGKGA